MTLLVELGNILREVTPVRATGTVTRSVGLLLEAAGPPARIGEKCLLHSTSGRHPVVCEVVGFSQEHVLLMPYEELRDIGVGTMVESTGSPLTVPVGPQMLGRVLDALAEPMDNLGPIIPVTRYPVNGDPPPALSRDPITEILPLGVRALDSLMPCGIGQRLGIFAGPGLGKSSLLGMIARNAQADVNVIALIGERGREVREFIERDLGVEGLQRSVVVVATSDMPPVFRLRGAQVATAIAEYFRDEGCRVMLMMDSVTRFAWAQREVGLATGEPPARNGYTPSVFAALPRLLERAGNSDRGSITALYTILMEADDVDDPVASVVRATLDGHIYLSRKLATAGHYPAVDVLESVSRTVTQITTPEHQKLARDIRACIAAYRDTEDLINLGAYVHGTNPLVDRALALREPINMLLRQDVQEASTLEECFAAMQAICTAPIPDLTAEFHGKLPPTEPRWVDN